MLEKPSRFQSLLTLCFAILIAFTAQPIIVLIPPQSCVEANCCCAGTDKSESSGCHCDPTAPVIRKVCGCDHRKGFTLDLGFVEPRLHDSYETTFTLPEPLFRCFDDRTSRRLSRSIAPEPPPPRSTILPSLV